ncbi:hypothetical protein [Dictyobacter kobayashii]|uniref:DUF624 domain-containing protein n=1 Tax=Dictyobacter kobayashii TaxID=2014872 RepID=A0A402AST0_9CHLR|nr:hypothetical protein [Dictyobacter kobayashii]GCE22170.1 hypothetical protein KDK_59700 [Dictyobacter kobayashii]
MAAFEEGIVYEEEQRNPVWSSFTLAKEHIEALVVINLVWSLTLLPVLAALGLGAWPLWLRLFCLFIGITAMAASSGCVFCLVAKVCEDDPLTWSLLRQTMRENALNSVRRLAPLYGVFGPGLLVLALASSLHQPLLEILVQFVLLWLLFCSLYWGPLFADRSDAPSWRILRVSLRLAWRYPAQSLRTGVVVLILLLFGAVSLVGILLIVPVLVALLQTYQYRQLVARQRGHIAMLH